MASTLHEVCSKPDGSTFSSIGPLNILSQFNPKENKNGEPFGRVIVGDGFKTLTIFLKGDAAMCCLPPRAEGVVLSGNFTKGTFNGDCLDCMTLDPPEGSTVYEPEELIGRKPNLTIKEALDVGMKAAEYMSVKMGKPELASAAFQVAAKAYLEHIPVK